VSSVIYLILGTTLSVDFVLLFSFFAHIEARTVRYINKSILLKEFS
jgi:hypothetical protein